MKLLILFVLIIITGCSSVKFSPQIELQISEYELRNFMKNKYQNYFLVDHCHAVQNGNCVLYLFADEPYKKLTPDNKKKVIRELTKFFQLRYRTNKKATELDTISTFVMNKDLVIAKYFGSEIHLVDVRE